MVLGHLMDRSVCSLNRKFHQVFNVSALQPMTKCFIQDFDRRLRRNFARLRATNAVRHGKDPAFAVRQKRVFIQRTLFVQTAIADSKRLQRGTSRLRICNLVIGLAHSTASSFNDERGSLRGPLASIVSRALRWEKAISIPNMAKLVMRLNPP